VETESVMVSVRLSVPSAYWPWLTTEQHATRPACISARHWGWAYLDIIARVSERPGRQQRQFQKTVENVSVCCSTTMRYTNSHYITSLAII